MLHRNSFLLSALVVTLLLLPACSTTEEAADTTVQTGEDAAEATVDAVEEAGETTGEVAEDVAEFVVDAAGESYDAVEDVFDTESDADAAALVRPTMAGTVQGTVAFEESDEGLFVSVSLRGLEPNTEHGFHIHQNPDCTPAEDAGGHWDPMNTNNHGAPTDDMSDKHLGDLGNIDIAADGTVESTFTVPNFPADEYDVAGHALVLHGGQDDLETDPAGDAGTRVGCGIIEGR